MNKGLTLVYTGNGKGKTTAALGAVLRSSGYKEQVAVVQFIKSSKDTGEYLFALDCSNIEFYTLGLGFVSDSKNINKDKSAALNAWEKVKELLERDDLFTIVLDEITYTVKYGFLSSEQIIMQLRNRNPKINVILTGRNCPQEIIDYADLVTEMNCVKHPFQSGIAAKKGIDY